MQQTKVSGRLSYIDTAKFLAIFLIVCGHCWTHFTPFLYSFHVQLFFVLIGYVYTPKFNSINQYFSSGSIVKLIYRIFVPFILFELLYDGLTPLNVLKALWGSNQTTSTLWFFPAYMSSMVLYTCVETLIRSHAGSGVKYSVVSLIVLVIFTCMASLTQMDSNLCFMRTVHLTGMESDIPGHIWLGFPFSFNIALMGFVLISFGRFAKHLVIKNVNGNRLLAFIIGIALLTIGVVFYKLNQPFTPDWKYGFISMSYAAYGNTLYFILTSCLLSLSAIFVSISIDNKLFAKFGKITLGIYVVHIFFNRLFTAIFDWYSLMDGFVFASEFKAVLVLLFTIPVVFFLNKYLPSLMGEK